MKLVFVILSGLLFSSAIQATPISQMNCRELVGVHNKLVRKIVATNSYYHGKQKIFDLQRLQRIYLLMWQEKRCDMNNSGIVSLHQAQQERQERIRQRYVRECIPLLDANRRKAYNACRKRVSGY